MLDVVGAVLLARGVVFQAAHEYVRENPGPLFPRAADPERDLAAARDAADARVGASLLVLGFVGQGVGAFSSDWTATEAGIAYAVAVVLIVLALLGLPRVRDERARAFYLAQLRLYPHVREEAREQWRVVLIGLGRARDRDRWER
jgi:hypothetical protein